MATKKAAAAPASAAAADRGNQAEIQRRQDAKDNATRQTGEQPPASQDINEPYVNPKLT